jgi:hypothetical protein
MLRTRFYGSAKRIKVKGDFNKKMDTAIMNELKEAARAFAVAAFAEVPIWTGQAAGTFIPLFRFLRLPAPNITPKDKLGRNRIAEGRVKGGIPAEMFHSTPGGFKSFTFPITLDYYAWQDVESTPFMHPPGYNLRKALPWGTLKVGEEAFHTDMSFRFGRNMPRLEDFLHFESVKIQDKLPF